MPGLSFLSKKSWHTSNLSNQEKVWIAEQKAESESRKVAELREQIKVEREREEFDRLTKGDQAVGDRGTNWMYEGGGAVAAGGGVGGGGAAAAREEEETRKNEAYLLGKEYVPEGKSKHSGDFVEASTMTGALEKASTAGATIGVGYVNNNADASASSSSSSSSGGVGTTRLRILRADAESTTTSAVDAASADDVIVDAKIKIDDEDNRGWSQNFHLRHEDPMFAVHQRRQAQLKDAEKRRRLLERAGLDVSAAVATRQDRDITKGYDEDDDYRNGEVSGVEKRKRRDKSEKKRRKRRRDEDHRRRHSSKSRIDEHRRRKSNPDDGDRSSSSSSSYSSSTASASSRRRRRHRDGKKERRSRSPNDDRRRRAKQDAYDDRRRDRHGSGRREGRSGGSRNGSGRRKRSGGEDDDYHRDRSIMTDYDGMGGRRALDEYHHMRNRGDERDDDGRALSSHPSPSRTGNKDGDTGGTKITGETRGGRYGLIGTSLSMNDDRNNRTATRHQPREDRRDNYLGPDRSLLESKRRAEAEERERLRNLSRKRI